LKASLPALPVVLNGGVGTIAQAAAHLAHMDGVMMGRAAYREPWRLLQVDPELFGAPPPAASARNAAERLVPYIESEVASGARLYAIVRHVLGLFHGVPGARAFRRHLAEEAVKPAAGAEVFRAALAKLVDGARDMGEMAA
jgi:tRNA-dihydrouridine synthase A